MIPVRKLAIAVIPAASRRGKHRFKIAYKVDNTYGTFLNSA
jgi:Ca2+/H+ antiporter